MNSIRDVFIVDGIRTPFVKSMTQFQALTREELMLAPLIALKNRYQLEKQPLGEVALGCLMNSASDWNLARECTLKAGINPYTPAYNVQQACGTSLETTLLVANKIALNQIDTGIAGGVDTNSDFPIELSQSMRNLLLQLPQQKTFFDKIKLLSHLRPAYFKPKLPAIVEPQTGLSMGQHCELMVKEWQISRQAQDELALASHQHAIAAYKNGFYDDLIVAIQNISKDGFPRADTTLDKLAKLKPAFDKTAGTITAGNSSPLTDGASAVLLASEAAITQHNWPKLARFVDAETGAVDFIHGDGLLMAPTIAVAKLLKRHNLSLQDFDFYEIHEAFAGQVLCTLKAWESEAYCQKYMHSKALGSIDRSKLNIVGSSVALGHPFAATGTRIVATLAKLLSGSKGKMGLISICTAGGMGVAAILESA